MTIARLAPAPAEGQAVPAGRVPWSFGPRALRLFIVGLVLLVPVWIDARAIALLLAWDAIVLVAWLVDLRRLPSPAKLVLRREWGSTLTLAQPQRVTLTIRNGGNAPIHVELTDFVSQDLRAVPPTSTLAVPPGAEGKAVYDVVPRVRGDISLGRLALSYRTPIGLAERWAVADLPQQVRVYPDIAEAQRQSLGLIRARQVVLEKRRGHKFGSGRDFESLREFQPGDELRDICWSATARRGRLVTRTYRPERSQTIWIVVDAGRLMRTRDGDHTSLDRAVNAAFALAQVGSTAGDRVGLFAYGRSAQQRVAPRSGAAHLRVMLEALAQIRPESAEADHARAAASIRGLQSRRALIVWLTDVAENAAVPEVIESAAQLVPRHVLLFAVMRPRDLTALARHVPENERDLYRLMAAQEMMERRALLLGQLRMRGAMAVEVPSAELTSTIVDRYLGIRERNLL
jgi:uncharacterized protein (DUF58 family)